MPVIQTDLLSMRYGSIRALDGLSLSMEGGAVGLLGPNGAGKSTLIKILLGFLAPDTGEARMFGLDTRSQSREIRQKIGYMPENESFLPGMTAVSYVRLAGRLVGMSSREAMQRTHMVLNYLGMGEERYRNIEGYSTGMKQKVKFAQALVHHPELLLLDEPTSGLDPRSRDEMLSIIREVARGKGIHVLLSTHILPDVEAVCDSVIILDKGRKIIQDEIGNLVSTGDSSYEVRIEGDGNRFREILEGAGGGSRDERGGSAFRDSSGWGGRNRPDLCRGPGRGDSTSVPGEAPEPVGRSLCRKVGLFLMGIHSQSYESWSGKLQSRLSRIWALISSGLGLPFSSKANLVVIGMIYLMILGWVFVLYIFVSSSAPPIFVMGNNLYRSWFFNHALFGFLLMILSATVGATLISRDLQHNALTMILSKAISRGDYLLSRFATLLIFFLQVTLLPGLVLWIGQWGMSPEDLSFSSRLRDLLAITLHSLVISIPFSAVVLAFSSFTRRPHVAGMLWVLFYLLTWIFSSILEFTVDREWCRMLWWQNLTARVGEIFYENRPVKVAIPLVGEASSDVAAPLETGPLVPALILFGVTVLGLFIVRVRLRRAEVRE